MADIDVIVTFKNDYVSEIIEAVDGYADKQLVLTAFDLNTPTGETFSFSYEAKKPEETNKEYGARVLKTLLKALVRCYFQDKDRDRWQADIAAVDPIDHNIPDEIVE